MAAGGATSLQKADLFFTAGAAAGNGAGAFMQAPLRIVDRGRRPGWRGQVGLGRRMCVLKGPNHLGEWVDGSVGKGFAYGAMGGLFFVQGDADSRFCVRLSGADVVAGRRPPSAA